MIKATQDGAVELYENGTKRLETTTSGINVTGAINVNGAALSAAPEVTGTATGAITADKAVCVKSDGTFEQVAQSVTLQDPVSKNSTDYQMHDSMPGDSWVHSAIDPNTQYMVFVFMAEGGVNAYYKLGKLNTAGTAASWYRTAFGNNYQSSSPSNTRTCWGKTDGGNPCWLLTCKNSSNLIVTRPAVVADGDTNHGTLGKNLDIASGLNITGTADNHDIVWNEASSKFWLCFSWAGGGGQNDRQYVRGVSVADGDKALTVAPTPGGGNSGSGGAAVRACIDPSTYNIFTFVVKSSTVKMIAWTWTGSSYTEGTMVNVVSNVYSTSGRNMQCAFDSVNNKIVVLYSNSDEDGRVIVGDVSGATVTWGTGIEYLNANVGGCTICYEKNLGRMLIAAKDEGNSNKARLYSGVTSGSGTGSTITFISNTLLIGGTATQYMTSIFDETANKILFGWCDSSNNNKGEINIIDMGSKTSNATDENFIGFAKSTVSNGATATVKVVGNTTTQSSLTPGQEYYLQMNGDISLTPDSVNSGLSTTVAGKALTSTSLLINPV
jgi:hypothetical protein